MEITICESSLLRARYRVSFVTRHPISCNYGWDKGHLFCTFGRKQIRVIVKLHCIAALHHPLRDATHCFESKYQPRQQSSWGQHGPHLGPVGPRRALCWPHEPCNLGGPVVLIRVQLSQSVYFGHRVTLPQLRENRFLFIVGCLKKSV